MKKGFYITTAIPYVNAAPHIGHALEFVQADAIRRYHELLGEETLLLSGGDENALKNVQEAEKSNIPIQQFVDKNSKLFADLAKKLNVKFDVFQKGSNQKHHFLSSQKLWELCNKNGDIYKKEYKGLYCVGCESFYTSEELDKNGECFEHPGKKLEEVSEENYFFKLSKYQKELVDLVSNNKLHIFPESRKNEILSFLKQPLHDISISRTDERAKKWGVPVPGDSTQRMYVWFDALNIYQSGIGFGWDDEMYKKWWPADVHVIGKGIIRFHAVYWPAFLLSANLPLPKTLFVHGYITADGQKMSKTIGNVIDPFKLIDKYGVDAVRYYFLREIPPFDDGDYSDSRMQEIYDSDLANELGNLVLRITTLAEKDGVDASKIDKELNSTVRSDVNRFIEQYQFNQALEYIWIIIKNLNRKIDENAPWKQKKLGRATFIIELIRELHQVGKQLLPFLPKTAEEIIKSTQGKIRKSAPLFPKK